MAQHTAGPWRIDASDKRHGDHRISSREGMVALVGNGHNIGGARHDAHLIAAAPDLLKALIALRNECSGTPRSSTLLALLANADLAIAKARGG